jgi:hypothetical protein
MTNVSLSYMHFAGICKYNISNVCHVLYFCIVYLAFYLPVLTQQLPLQLFRRRHNELNIT